MEIHNATYQVHAKRSNLRRYVASEKKDVSDNGI